MKKQSGKEYEKIVAAIHKQFAKNAQVKENDKIIGKSGDKRQIDLSIKTSILGYPILIIVDCKDYKRKVDKGRVDELIGKLQDVGAHQGVLVSDSGFTSGAIKRANQDNRIQLSSVIDVENKKLRSKLLVPIICEFRYPLVKFTIQETGIVPFSIDANFMNNLRKRFIKEWNKGKLGGRLGVGSYKEVIKNTPKQKIEITYTYEVKRRIFYKKIGLAKAKGIYNVSEKKLLTNEIVLEKINILDIEKKWKQITTDDIPKASITLVALDVFIN